MKKMTFIYPAIGKKKGCAYIKTWKMEPLPIATLAALTPDRYEVEFFDDRLELIDYDTPTDLVAITVETYTAQRAYRIARKFRQRGVPVVMGGYHPTHLPEETHGHADAVVIGNAETVWADLLSDAQCKRLKPFYTGRPSYAPTLPDRRIFDGKAYLKLGLVETGRGCPFTCDFCHITTYYQGTYYPRPIKEIIADIEQSGKKFFFFVDDNLVAHPAHTIALCKELAKRNIYWSGQGTLTMAKHPEMLYWMKKSGCCVLLIGFESLEEANLKQMNKDWSAKLGERNDLVRRIHQAGINIYATFIFGFDYDTPDTFRRAVDFSLAHDFFYAAYNHLLPFPGTPLYERLRRENRLTRPQWWLDADYTYGQIAFTPRHMAAEELSRHCVQARQAFFRYASIMKRGLNLLRRKPPLGLLPVYLMSNLNLQEEVEGKLNLPLGDGLDEMPK